MNRLLDSDFEAEYDKRVAAAEEEAGRELTHNESHKILTDLCEEMPAK